MTKFKLFSTIIFSALLTAMTVDALPCVTGGTPRRPTPSPKHEPKSGASSRANTPVKK